MNQGKVAIVTMLGVGMALSAFAWWARYSRSQQVLSVWGRDAVVAIRNGDKVELLQLVTEPPESSDSMEAILVGSEKLYVAGATDITDVPGLIHARHHFIHEKGFRWSEPRSPDCQPEWATALRFTDGESVATMLLDFDCQRAHLVERNAEVGMQPIALAMQKFLSGVETDSQSQRRPEPSSVGK